MLFQSFAERQNEVTRLEAASTQLDEELRSTKGAVQNLTETLEDKDSQNKVTVYFVTELLPLLCQVKM